MRIAIAEVGGQLVRYARTLGSVHRTPLLLFNGIGAKLEVLEPLLNALSRLGTNSIVFDVPGVGESPAPLFPYHFSSIARLAADLLRRLDISCPVDVLGFSWGGGLAQQFAFQFPKHCRRLVLVATSAGAVMIPGKLSEFGRLVAPASLFRTDWGYLCQLLAGMSWTSIGWLASLRQPTLVLMGTNDPLVPVINGYLLAFLIPNARLRTFQDGHLFLISRAAEVAPLVHEFLDGDAPEGEPRHQPRSVSGLS